MFTVRFVWARPAVMLRYRRKIPSHFPADVRCGCTTLRPGFIVASPRRGWPECCRRRGQDRLYDTGTELRTGRYRVGVHRWRIVSSSSSASDRPRLFFKPTRRLGPVPGSRDRAGVAISRRVTFVATIVGGLVMRLDRSAAAEFSFFLAMPTMIGAFAHDLWTVRAHLAPERALEIAIGFTTAFVAAVFVVRPFLRFVSRSGFAPFAWYRIAAGVLILGAMWARWL